ncbi:Growth-Arrest-Specific Protein 2 Domain [Microdochium nivale]|nr:Growth-Arrest-Specific Protein 2 Domain [Microdochium nivale]
MADIHRSITPSGFATIRPSRHFRIASGSPTRNNRYSDDTEELLRSLKPFCVIDSLRSPIGALKTCLDEASASEQAFAMRAAAASKHINDWYEELSEWPWPRNGGSAGFEPARPPGPPQRQVSAGSDTTITDDNWRGSISFEDVVAYQHRVEKILEEMDAFNIDEMKKTVLHTHILPLSRPGTPLSDTGQSITSALSYVKMHDLTAVITAIVLYCLPILSRLSKLMNAWSIRLTVLDKVPELLLSLEDVEAALEAGWNVVAPPQDAGDGSSAKELSQGTFDVMRKTLEPKVTKVCKLMDFMLDSLEATPDTVPDSWVDRVDKVEQSWREWVVAGDHRVRGGEWTKRTKPFEIMSPPGSKLTIQVHAPSPTRTRASDVEELSCSPPLPFDHSSIIDEDPEQIEKPGTVVVLKKPAATNGSPVKVSKRETPLAKSGSRPQPARRAVPSKASNGDAAQIHVDGASEPRPRSAHGQELRTKSSNVQKLLRKFSQEYLPNATRHKEVRLTQVILSEVNRNIVRMVPSNSPKKQVEQLKLAWTPEEDSDDEWNVPVHEASVLDSSFMEPSVLETVEEEEGHSEPDLPRYPRRMASNISMASTVLHDTSRLMDLDASDSFREESMDFELPPLPDPDQPLFSSDAISPPSSPPLRFQQRAPSVSFDESPQAPPRYEFGPPLTQDYLNSSAVFVQETPVDYESRPGGHSRTSTGSMTSEEDHMHQQIREVLQNIPAQIKLSRTSKPPVNLNPPDFQHPTKSRTRAPDPIRRSGSAMSSRAGTPSSLSRSVTPAFMLAPVRETRQRSKSSQEIKAYHLSRSTGEAPIKLFIRCVGENGERVMVRVGGGWSDLGEYLKEYAAHHGRKSKGEGKVEVRDSPQPAGTSRHGSSPANRPASAMENPSTPLAVRKSRRSMGEHDARRLIRTPITIQATNSPSPDFDTSRMSVRSDFDEEHSSLGLAGPKPAKKQMSDESRAWVESVKEKVRLVSGERPPPFQRAHSGSFGTLDKVGGTTRLFRKK